MKRRKQGNRALMEKHIQERKRNLDEMARLTARNEELESIIREEEDLEIVALVRSRHMGLMEFQSFLEGRQNSGVPSPVSESTNEQEDMKHEA